ncbi:hypothetical protein X777_17001 [Ooceraea biroi]|uniref:Uncharacterized protein n=1 Tax=Ooceraea biroi TaxID=2015173 RepID=A0A026WTQ2_OOCBI|nr:hypothetical protein X777_17001 [Ooceraea biroi]
MADAECEVHPAIHALDGGYRRGTDAIFYYLNGMPGRRFVG